MSTQGNNLTAGCSHSTGFASSLEPSQAAVRVVLYVVATVAILSTVAGNLLVVISVCHFKQLHTPTNVLILSLALCDMLTAMFVMPSHFVWQIESCRVFGDAFWMFYYLSTFLMYQSVNNVTLLAVDRCVALNYPFFYMQKVTLKVSFIVAAVSWLWSILYQLVLCFNGIFPASPHEGEGTLSEEWLIADIIVVFVFPCCVMVIVYVQIFALAKKHSAEIRKVNKVFATGAKKHMQVQKSEKKAAKVVAIVVSVFLLSVVPYYSCSLLVGIIHAKLLHVIFQYTTSCFLLNSLFNPLIYALFYPCFQKSCKLIFRLFVTESSVSNVIP